jgi:hypothetical protein
MYKLVRMIQAYGHVTVPDNEAAGNQFLVKLSEALLSAELFLLYPFNRRNFSFT